ncbi:MULTISPECIES: 30S ribosomal protein S20 [Peptoniphilus]|jgi:ribosomal protein S20|uniref:30S ribosomal protein S20 n=1 Tax=Peptoniphilus TaxID=162289 RepID=UPI000288EAF3|nr:MULTISPECIES: 30S ribosomal protein S20 [Peptoniphilus]MBS6610992.1 30S ribosomal protein S20 [Peptoniphilus harei]MDU1043244.1 30S ribosomal protein S20 [Peptoniphilus rhinitidis]MDU1953961.1 30S ribosomal protein S20 [Peptoniphilus lacydonensis]MDU2115199.1 30S ribosomal protein S20 [Peptoniphilus lacydonensis]MDU3750840.1 30S ribosomal protein S20 [Peptoniphilus rhinitidis]
MANIKSAIKRIDVAKRNSDNNKPVRTEMKNAIRNFNKAIDEDRIDDAKELLIVADKKLKKAANKNIIHKNQASRKLSRLAKKLNDKTAEMAN